MDDFSVPPPPNPQSLLSTPHFPPQPLLLPPHFFPLFSRPPPPSAPIKKRSLGNEFFIDLYQIEKGLVETSRGGGREKGLGWRVESGEMRIWKKERGRGDEKKIHLPPPQTLVFYFPLPSTHPISLSPSTPPLLFTPPPPPLLPTLFRPFSPHPSHQKTPTRQRTFYLYQVEKRFVETSRGGGWEKGLGWRVGR